MKSHPNWFASGHAKDRTSIKHAPLPVAIAALSGGQFHPYRRLWATERKGLPVQDVAATGGWKTVETVQWLYQQADGATTLEAVEAGQ